MKLETYLGRNFGKLSAFQEIMAIGNDVADVAMPVDEANEIVVGKLNMFEKRLLTLIKLKTASVSCPGDYYNVSMLAAVFFAQLMEKYTPIVGAMVVIRKNHTVCIREITDDNPEYFALAFVYQDEEEPESSDNSASAGMFLN